MKIICNKCNASYKIDDSKIKGNSIKTRCPKCKSVQENFIEHKSSAQFNLDEDTLSSSFNDKISNTKEKDPFSVPLKTLSSEGEFLSIPKKVKKVKKVPQFDLNSLNEDEKEIKKKNKFAVDEATSFNAVQNKTDMVKKTEKPKLNKNTKQKKSFLKKLTKAIVVILIIVGISVASIFGIKKVTEKNIINNKNENNPKIILKEYTQEWKKNIIESAIKTNVLYLKALENFYKNSENFYPVASTQFKEVFIRMPENLNAFYYTIISDSFSTNKFPKDTLKKYYDSLKILETLDKDNYLLYVAQSSVSFRLGDKMDSSNIIEKALKINPNSGLALFISGKFYFKTDAKKAINFFKKAITNNPKLIIAKDFLSETYIKNGLYKEGVDFFKNLNTERDKYTIATILLEIGDAKKSLEILRRSHLTTANLLFAIIKYQFYGKNNVAEKLLLNIEKNNFSQLSLDDKIITLEHLLNLYRLGNNKTKVIEYAEKLNNLKPNMISYNFNLALININNSNFKEAEILIEKIKERTSKEYNILKVEYFLKKKDYNSALKYVSKLIESFPYDVSYRLRKLLIASLKDDIDLLNDTITNMTTVEPDFSIRNRFKIDLFVIQKDYSYIKKYLSQKLKVTENKELILKDLAVLEFYFKNYNSSLRYFSKSNEIVDRNYVNYLYSGYIYFLKKSYNKAIEEAQKSIKLNKFSIFSYLLIVKSYLKINKIKEAKKYLAEIKDNSDKTNYLTLMEVLILIKEGNNDLAKEKLKSVHNFFSNDYLVKQLLFKL